MRLLSILFLFFLALHSHFVFSEPPPTGASDCSAVCTNNNQNCGFYASNYPDNFFPPGSYSSGADSTAGYLCSTPPSCQDPLIYNQGYCVCPVDTFWSEPHKTCLPNSCPEGQIVNVVVVNGVATASCIDDPDTNTPQCPSGGIQAPDGSCPVCPGGQNPDGSCIDPTQCGEGETKLGEVNGTAVCAGTCSDPNQSWGFVNGVEGCYGAPTCPNGGSYGTVNGVSGCYGGGGSGDGSGDGSGGAGGSSGGDGSGGAGGSSGGDGGNGGDGSGGNNGGGNGGGGGGSNNDIGSNFGESEQCPAGKIKLGNVCVSDGRGDCPVNYHELVVSRDPYLFICVPDDPPPASSAASSQPSSNSSQASSSPSSQSASAASGGAGGSSVPGGGGGGGAGDGDSGSGDCDPTGADYFKCAGLLEELKNDDLQEMYQNIDDTNSDSLSDYEKLLTDDLQDFDDKGGVSFATNETNALKSLMSSFLPVATACNPPALNILGKNYQLDCTYFDTFKLAFGWFLAVLTAFQIWQMAIRPVER